MTKEPDRNPRKALGKGLSALLPSRPSTVAAPQLEVEPQPLQAREASILPHSFDDFASIPLDHIQPNEDQPRTSFDVEKLEELARSIQANGLLQPITVHKVGENQYRLIAGERRWRAARRAGLNEIPALVRNVEQQQRLELALIENIQREDLNAIEIAVAFQNLAADHGLSHEQIAERTGKDRSTITNFLRLLRLSSVVQNELISGRISAGHARALLNIADERQQIDFCRRIVNEGLSVRETERKIKELTKSPAAAEDTDIPKVKPEQALSPALDANIRAALDAISSALGTKVTLRAKTENTGSLEIEYYSQEDLDRIYSVIVE